MYERLFKRVFDFFSALIGLILLSPIIVSLTIILAISFKGRPFFFQERPGIHEKKFFLIKFKSMNDNKDQKGNLLPNHLRITHFGRFIRKTSLDELPQLFNVLKGDLSLVGPRPLLAKYLPLYNDAQRRRHDVRPGMTGWAQVNGRNAISWARKFEFDVWYVEHISFQLDLHIIRKTLMKVLRGEGVNVSKEITMEPFDGTN